MAEVITIYQLTGSGPTYNEATAIRFCASDTFNPGLTTPCKVPPSGIAQYNSYWITLCLHYSGDFSLINNFRLWGPGNIADTWFPGDKGRMVVGRKDTGDHGFVIGSSYQQAGGTSGVTGYGLKAGAPNGHAQYRTQTIALGDVDDFSEGSPLVIDSTNITATGYSKAFCLQTECYPEAGHGEMTPVTLVLAVDVV
jgi:hypothetical protein